MTVDDGGRYITCQGGDRISPRKNRTNGIAQDKHAFNVMVQAMDRLGISDLEKDGAFRVLAATLHLGNLDFKDDENGHAVIEQATQSKPDCSYDPLEWIANLTGLDRAQVKV